MNLLEDYKDEINQAMIDIFDTFSRENPVRFYKPTEEEVIIFDPQFNADLSEYNNPNVERTPQFKDFKCRVIFPKRESTWETFIAGGSNLQGKGEQDLGILNIQFQKEAYEYVKDCIRFTFEGEKYTKHASIRKLGILDTFQIYQLTLKKVN